MKEHAAKFDALGVRVLKDMRFITEDQLEGMNMHLIHQSKLLAAAMVELSAATTAVSHGPSGSSVNGLSDETTCVEVRLRRPRMWRASPQERTKRLATATRRTRGVGRLLRRNWRIDADWEEEIFRRDARRRERTKARVMQPDAAVSRRRGFSHVSQPLRRVKGVEVGSREASLVSGIARAALKEI